jgi:hypothetical protein
MPISEFLSSHPHDHDAAISDRMYQADECANCGTHPSMWKEALGGYRNAIVPKWVFCRPCELLEQAQAAGPPTDAQGWRLILTHRERDADRE